MPKESMISAQDERDGTKLNMASIAEINEEVRSGSTFNVLNNDDSVNREDSLLSSSRLGATEKVLNEVSILSMEKEVVSFGKKD